MCQSLRRDTELPVILQAQQKLQFLLCATQLWWGFQRLIVQSSPEQSTL